MFSSSLTRSGSISETGVRSAQRYHHFHANHSIKERECDLSRTAMDRAYDRSLNAGMIYMGPSQFSTPKSSASRVRATQSLSKTRSVVVLTGSPATPRAKPGNDFRPMHSSPVFSKTSPSPRIWSPNRHRLPVLFLKPHIVNTVGHNYQLLIILILTDDC